MKIEGIKILTQAGCTHWSYTITAGATGSGVKSRSTIR